MNSLKDKKPIIGIIGGTSKFGAWFKNFFESQGLEVLIASRKTELKPQELAKKTDIVIVSVPISSTGEVIKEIRDLVRPDALLCDFTSVKEQPLKEMMKTKSRCGVMGLHPLFGPLVRSIKNQVVVFCSGRDNHWTKFLKNLFEQAGAKVIFTEAKKHDQQMAVIQALTHFVNISFAKAIHDQKLKLLNAYTTPVFRLQSVLTGRILGSGADLYADLEMENPAFLKVLDDYLEETRKLASFIKNKDKEKFVAHFEGAASAIKGFIPIAQQKTEEIISLMDRQPVELNKETRRVGLKNGNSVAYLGPEGTFSHQALLNIFSGKQKALVCPTITKIFEKVFNEEAALGIVPAENSSEGIIQETLDNLAKYPLRVVGSYHLPVQLCLMARTENVDEIKIIKSHRQPLAQAQNWLAKNFPDAKLEIEPSSAQAILSTNDRVVAFVAGRQAAKKYGLKILAEDISDKKTNITQFYIIAKKETPALSKKIKAGKTLLLLAVYDRVGVLRDILNCLADHKINLSKLHSRVSEAEGWDYYFFLEAEGLPHEQRIKDALKGIGRFCPIIRVLGVT